MSLIVNSEISSILSHSKLGIYGETGDDRLVIDVEDEKTGDYAMIDMRYDQAVELFDALNTWINAKRKER